MARLQDIEGRFGSTDLQQMMHGLLGLMDEYFRCGPGEIWSGFVQTVIPGLARGRGDPRATIRYAAIFFARVLVSLDRRLAGEVHREQAVDEMTRFIADFLAAMDAASEQAP